MEDKDQKSKLSLKEERDNVRDAIWRANIREDWLEVERLEGHLIKLDKQIRRKHGMDTDAHS
jgi:hypothetical protein